MLEQALKEIGKALLRIFETIERITQEVTDSAFCAQKEIEKDKKVKQTWIVPYDNRKKSQVLKVNVPQIRIRNNL